MCISFAFDTLGGKDLYLLTMNEAVTAKNDSGDKGCTGVVSPNHAKWKAHYVAHKEAQSAPSFTTESRRKQSGVAAARRTKCPDVEAVSGVEGTFVRALLVDGPVRGVDGTGVDTPLESSELSPATQTSSQEGMEVPKATLLSSKEWSNLAPGIVGRVHEFAEGTATW